MTENLKATETRVKVRGGDIEVEVAEIGVNSGALIKVALEAWDYIYQRASREEKKTGQFL